MTSRRNSLITRALAIALGAGLVLSSNAPAQPVRASLQTAIDRIDALAAAEQAKDAVGSVTIGVVTDAGLIWTRSYGHADGEKRIAATKDTVYRIGSITKQFTGLMLQQLAHAGKVHLSDPVERYLPEVNTIARRRAGTPPITLVQLATMTSGLGREPANLATYLSGPVAQWERTLVAALAETKFDHEPGAQYLYSNIGYAILGAALGRAAGVPYTEYVRERILVPLQMTQSAFEPTPAIQSVLANGYAIDGKGGVDAATPRREHAGRGYKVPNGALYTTVGDLARFLAFELGAGPETVLPKAVLDAHQSRVQSASGRLDSGYGIGFQLSRRGEHVFLGHGGSVAGYTAQAWIHRPSKSGVIVLRNAAGGRFDLSGLTFRALTELAGAAAPATASRR